MNAQLPQKWEERLAADAKELASRERPNIAQISLRSGIMQYQGQMVPGNRLECVIVASAFQNRYYGDKPFDPNNMSNPICYALSLTGEEMSPHEDSPEKQADFCETCPQSKWGSDPRPNSRGKACKSVRRLAIIPAAALKDGNIKKAEMAMLTIPVTSARNWANYVNQLSADYQRPPWGMLTEVSVIPDPKTQFQVRFNALGIVQSDEALAEIFNRVQASADVLLTPYDNSGNSEVEEKKDDGKQKKY